MAWTLAQPRVHVAVVGARRPDHTEGTAPAAEIALEPEDLRGLDRIMSSARGPSPEAA